MKNNLKFYLMSALCSLALINTSGHSMHNHQNAFSITKPNKGLENIGATCYMNATLQCFASCKELVDYFKTSTCNQKIMSFSESEDAGKRNTYDFIKLMKDMNNPKSSPKPDLAPTAFKDSLSNADPLFAGIQANDSKDLVIYLLENTHNQLNNPIVNPNQQQFNPYQQQFNQYDYQNTKQQFLNSFHSNYQSKISELFYGVYNSMMQCSACQATTHNMQCYNILIFPLEEVRKYKNLPGNIVTLDDCFQHYEKVERMTGDNTIWCNNCRRNAPGYQQTRLVTSPEYLIINLNRGKGLQFDVKFQTPEVVDLGKYVFDQPNNSKYRLMGIIVHIGPSGMSGHFIAYTKKDGQVHWFRYNDSIVDEVEDISSILNGEQTSYVLFYKKIDDNTYNQLTQQEINTQQQAPKNNVFNNNNVQLNNINQLNIFMSPELLINGYYLNNCNNQLHTKYNINTDENKYFQLFNYDPIKLKTFEEMKMELDLLLQKTMQFLTDYSIQENMEVCKEFAKIWQKYSNALYKKSNDRLDPEQENYFNLKLSFDLICDSFLWQYNIKVNTSGNNITMDNLPKQFGKLNINNNINPNKQDMTVDQRFNAVMTQHGLAKLNENMLNMIVQGEREKIPNKHIKLNNTQFEKEYEALWNMSHINLLDDINQESMFVDTVNNVLRDTLRFYHYHSPDANKKFCDIIQNVWNNILNYLQDRGEIYADKYLQPVKIIITSLKWLNNIDKNNKEYKHKININNNIGMHKDDKFNDEIDKLKSRALQGIRIHTAPKQMNDNIFKKDNINIGNKRFGKKPPQQPIPNRVEDITIDTDNRIIADYFRRNGRQSREGNVISKRELNFILDKLKKIVPSNLGMTDITNVCTLLLQQTILIIKAYKKDQHERNEIVYQALRRSWKDVFEYVFNNCSKTSQLSKLMNRLVNLEQLLAQCDVSFIGHK